jgi:RHS repeat-associated protein
MQRLSHKPFTVSWRFLRSAIPVLIVVFLLTGTAQGVVAPTHTDAAGNQIRQQRDLLGQLLRQEDPDGGIETLRWNALGLPTQHINRAGDVERWEYTLRGQVIAHTDFEGRKTRSTYNARQQLSRLERGEAVYRFHWDATGHLLAEQQPDGVEQHYRYGVSGDLIERTDKGKQGSGTKRPERQTRYAYDRNGQLTERHTQTQSTRYTWDNMGRLTAIQKTDRTPTPTEKAVPPTEITFTYDPLGRILSEAGQHGQIKRNWDALAHPESLTLPQGQTLAWQRYGSGHVHGMLFNQEELTGFERDALHREIKRSQGKLQSTKAYDLLGRTRWQKSQYPQSGQFAGKHRATPTADQTHPNNPDPAVLIERSYTYRKAGEVERIDDKHRGQIRLSYDRDGRLLERYRDGAALGYQSERFGWDETDNHYPITGGTTPHPGASAAQALAQERAPTEGNRLLGYLFQKAGIERPEQLDYDPYGRLIARRDEQGKLLQLLHWDEEDQLAAIEDEQGTTLFAYDPLGRRSDKWHQPNDPQKQSSFQQKAREAEKGRSLKHWAEANIIVDGEFRQKAAQTPGTRHTRFIWEGMRLLQEIGQTPDPEGRARPNTHRHANPNTNQRVRTWVYEPDGTGYVPLAAIDQNLNKAGKAGKATIHYIHTDHLGTPQELTDAEGKIEWSADYSAWGERRHSLVLDKDEEAEQRTDCALRFQGQYFDAETGLHYNTFRYYDPGCGRFISPDPINLLGGLNLYQYAPNAANWIDPWGLSCGPTKFHKRTTKEIARLRHNFEKSGGARARFLKGLARKPNAEKMWGAKAVQQMKKGKLPDGMVVHHKKPIFRGGNNRKSNLELMDKADHAARSKDLHWYQEGENPYGLN